MTLILFLAILSVLVLVHELGHFLMAKRAGILVEEFGFGLPPRIWQKKIGKTIYSVNLLPFGGFVKLFGENETDEESKIKDGKLTGRAFFEKTKKEKIGVILAGVTMNFLLAIFVFSLIYTITGIPVKTGQIRIEAIAKDSPAEMMGLKPDDVVVALDGQKLKDSEEFVKLVKEKAGKVVRLEIKRDRDNPCQQGERILGGMAEPGFEVSCHEGNLLVAIIPRTEPPEGQGPLGVVISETEMKKYSGFLMPLYGIREGFKESVAWGKMILKSLGEMIKNLLLFRQVPKDVVGPIGIYQVTGMVAKSGILALLEFLGILSVNLAIINVLPFPALDGGRLLFLGIETFFGKKIAPKVETWVNNLGMVFLLLLMVLITINDIVRTLVSNKIFEKIRMVF